MKTTAGEVLARAGIDAVRLARDLPNIDVAGVPIRSARRWFRLFWAPWVTALALPWGIYLHPSHFERGLDSLGPLVVHELTHLDQWRRLGARGWAVEYIGSYRRGRKAGLDRQAAYRAIPLEEEARELARRYTPA